MMRRVDAANLVQLTGAGRLVLPRIKAEKAENATSSVMRSIGKMPMNGRPIPERHRGWRAMADAGGHALIYAGVSGIRLLATSKEVRTR
jgi:hypothetical protein